MAVCGELYAALPAPSQAALRKRKVRDCSARAPRQCAVCAC